MVQKHLLNLYHARTAGMLSGASRVAMMLLTTLLLTMTAQTAWAETTVRFNRCGGEGGTDYVTAKKDQPMPKISVPTRDGCIFGGYYSEREGGGQQYYNADGTSAHDWDRNDETFELHAKWTAYYTVTFDKCGGDGGDDDVTATYGKAMLDITVPTRDGYTFGGYFTAPDGDGTQYYNADGSSAQPWDRTENTTLFAKWTPEEYTITFVDENGITVLQSGNVAYGQTPAYNGETPTKAATAQYTYTFSGWDPEVAQVTGDETYTATYNSTPVPYTITYEVYGGTNNESNPTTYTCESGDITLAAPTAPENSGYTFGGWYTDANFTTAVSTTAIPQGSTGEMTFYAKWLKSVTVTVNWSDNSNQDGIRPESVVVILLANSEEDDEVTVTKPEGNPNSWTGTAVNKPVHKAGAPIVYTWAMANEKIPTGYTFGIDDENATLNLTHEPEKTEAKVNVAWDDVNNQDGKRPESVTVTLSNGAAVTLNESNNWNATVGNLPKYASGQPITYTWTEGTLPDGYSKTHTSTSTDELGVTTTTLQLSYTPEKTGATVKVVWDDNDDQDGIRPESVTVTLSNGAAVTLNESNNWNATVGNLPKYASGQPITYTWTEGTLPDGYSKTHTSTSTDELGVTTTTLQLSYTPEETEVKVTKVWDDSDNQDGKRPDDVTVNLLADGKIIDTVTLSEENEWNYSWTRLDKKANGEDIDYTVTEVAVAEYTTNITKATDGTFTYTVTNSHETEETEATVELHWNDNNNQDGIRPESVTVTLSNGTEVTLNVNNNWTATVEDLPKYASGQEIAYTWTPDETNLSEGYLLTDSSKDGTTTTLTYSHTPGETSVTANVVWSDGNNTEGFRPESVTVKLMNGEEIGSVSLNASNNWSYTWTGLPTHEGGEAITYTVTEDAVDNYSTTIEGFTITNSRTVEMTTATLNIIWLDDTNKYGVRPASLNATLSDGTNETSYTINENLLNGTYFSFIVNNLQKYINGTEIVYSLTITDEIDCYKQTGLDKNGNTTTYTMHLMTMGNCGQTGSEAALTWEYNTAEKTLYIIGSGQMMYYNSVQNGESWSNGAPWKAFANEIEHVVISDGITYVGSNTFAHCPNISSVTLPTSGIYEIGPGAFADCTSLESIDIPMSINTIGKQAFAGCSSLATVSIGYGDPGTFTLGSEVFPVTTTILVPESAYENYIREKAVKESVEIDNPFYGYKDKIVPATRTFFATSTNTWMTWCDKYAWTLPEGCTAYTVGGIDGSTVTLNAVTDGVIPAYTPVLLHKTGTTSVKADFSAAVEGTPGIQTATGTTGCTFYGTTTELTPAIPVDNYVEGQTYILRGDKFIKADDNEGIAANKCWLVNTATGGARQLSIVIDNESTGIEELKNGRIEELKSAGAWYSLDGRKLDGKPTKKGLYINNGKKTVISKE